MADVLREAVYSLKTHLSRLCLITSNPLASSNKQMSYWNIEVITTLLINRPQRIQFLIPKDIPLTQMRLC